VHRCRPLGAIICSVHPRGRGLQRQTTMEVVLTQIPTRIIERGNMSIVWGIMFSRLTLVSRLMRTLHSPISPYHREMTRNKMKLKLTSLRTSNKSVW
jgi:hypothetical protein